MILAALTQFLLELFSYPFLHEFTISYVLRLLFSIETKIVRISLKHAESREILEIPSQCVPVLVTKLVNLSVDRKRSKVRY